MASAPKIQKLDEVVINRIAAGEVIQRPANAIKEMIENCLDAKASSIQVSVKSGGLKLLQIVDDGCGIRKDDMPIVCERFTTSKLSSFDDLKSISTYGFRGEALASISHVAHLTITTKTADSQCAYKAKYEDGKMIPLQPGASASAKPCAGNKGTQITVEDLFYNVAVRRKALKNANEEYLKIADIISKYSIHNPSVAFTLKKFGENIGEVRTQVNSTVVDNIKNIYGPTVAKELLEVSNDDSKYGFKMTGHVSNANYNMKKCVFLLFINHRLVESSALKKALEAVYINYLPKDKHPFMYMSVEINPLNVDVNVHPTKHEVKFLHEDVIIEQIQKCVETKLLGANESRQYYTQMLLPKMISAGIDNPMSEILSDAKPLKDEKSKVYAHQMVRTDAREQKMQAFFSPAPRNYNDDSSGSTKNIDTDEIANSEESRVTETLTYDEIPEVPRSIDSTIKIAQPVAAKPKSNIPTTNRKKETPNERQIKLTSIKNLQKFIDDREHLGLKNILEDHKFVGCVNKSLSLVQHLTRLYLVNSQRLSQELFYQILIFKFGNFGYIQLSNPAPIYELAILALESPDSGWSPSDGSKEDLAKYAVELLSSKSEMLLDYFSFEINEQNELVSLPLLLPKFVPNLNGLPMLLLRIATEVNWESEEECFQTFAIECSRFYSFGPDPLDIDENGNDESNNNDENNGQWKHTVEHVLFPSFRTSLLPPKGFSEDGTFLEVANLPDLYKVFERC